MKDGPLVVVGDSMLDVDLVGQASRLAPDAPVPVVDCLAERHRPGGAGLAAVLAAADGADVILVTALGGDRHGTRLREALYPHVEVLAMPMRGGTPCKVRIQADGRPMLRLDAGDGRCADGYVGPAIAKALAAAGAVLVADYGRGITAHPGIAGLLAGLRPEVPVIWDPHPKGTAPPRGVRVVVPNAGEARQFAAPPGPRWPPAVRAAGPLSTAAADAASLARRWRSAVAVTLGDLGAVLSTGGDVPFVAPAPPAATAGPVDTCGAGDRFAATLTQVLRSGGVLTEAVVAAVRAASEFVGRGGAGLAVPALDVPAPAEPARAECGGSAGSAWETVARVRSRGGRVVATGGCFDVLHAGHVSLLRQARRLGDCLVVCLNSDESVRALKGPGRPLNPAGERAAILAALEPVDAVVTFSEPTPAALLRRLRPDVWVKGGDYAAAELAEAGEVRRHGGEVVLLPYLDGVSTSRIVAAAKSGEAAVSGDRAPR